MLLVKSLLNAALVWTTVLCIRDAAANDKPQMAAKEEKELIWKFVVDAVLLIIVIALVPLFHYEHFTPFHRGFFCNDETIRYPYRYSSTITSAEVYAITLVIGMLIIVLPQLCSKYLSRPEGTPDHLRLLGHALPHPLRRAVRDLGVFLSGYCLADICACAAKAFFGRLRPNFIQVCRPDVFCNKYQHYLYVGEYNCTNPDVAAVADARRSFPSQHCVLMAYAMAFSALYIQRKVRLPYSRLALPVLQVVMVMLVVYTAASKVTDYMHHWGDVVAGSLAGTAFAFFFGYLIPVEVVECHLKVENKTEKEKEILERTCL